MGLLQHKYVGFLLGLFFLTTSCLFSTDFASIPIPKYHFPAKTEKDIYKELLPRLDMEFEPTTVTFDTHYVGIKYEYFEKFNKWYAPFLTKINNEERKGNKGENSGEAYDCDNHAMLYKSLMSCATLKKKSALREILVGVIVVVQTEKALGIPSSHITHALNIVFTDKGWIVYEPQTGQHCPLSEYPNVINTYIF